MTTDPLAFVGLAVALLAGLSWIIKAQISMSKQFTPNGGSSLRDAVNRLEKDAQETRQDIKEMRQHEDERAERIINSVGKVHARLDEHVRDHLTSKEK
jgi:translation initiation factor 2B subunit (eIF-2B alpha/beta/delta family)